MSENNGTKKLAGGLPPELINTLLAKSKTRNQYGPKLVEFDASDEAAVNVVDAWPEFAEKNTATLYQGFKNALDKTDLNDMVQVRKYEDNVFLLHKERVAVLRGESVEDTDDDSNTDEDAPSEVVVTTASE